MTYFRIELDLTAFAYDPNFRTACRKKRFSLPEKLLRRVTLGLDFDADFRSSRGILLFAQSAIIASPSDIDFEEP